MSEPLDESSSKLLTKHLWRTINIFKNVRKISCHISKYVNTQYTAIISYCHRPDDKITELMKNRIELPLRLLFLTTASAIWRLPLGSFI